MTQLSSDVIAYEQALAQISSFMDRYRADLFESKEQMLQAYSNLINNVNSSLGGVMTKFEPVFRGEPPSSRKMNGLMQGLARDSGLISKQLDALRAKLVSNYNLFSREVDLESASAQRIKAKAKILQLYTLNPLEDLSHYGDSFDNYGNIDNAFPIDNPLVNITDGYASNNFVTTGNWVPNNIVFEEGSNGFPGNNHMTIGPKNRFVFERGSNSSTQSIVDNNPNTYFEYEIFDFNPRFGGPDREYPLQQYEFQFEDSNNRRVFWNRYFDNPRSDVRKDNKLTLNLSLEKNVPERANKITITPYFGTDDQTYTIRIPFIYVFYKDDADGQTKSMQILSHPIFIGHSLVPNNPNKYKSYYYKTFTRTFPEKLVSKIQIVFEQNRFQAIPIKHRYWEIKRVRPRESDTARDAQGVIVPANALIDELSSDDFPREWLQGERFHPNLFRQHTSLHKINYDLKELIPSQNNPNEFKTSNDVKVVNVIAQKKYNYNYSVIEFTQDGQTFFAKSLETRDNGTTRIRRAERPQEARKFFFDYDPDVTTPNPVDEEYLQWKAIKDFIDSSSALDYVDTRQRTGRANREVNFAVTLRRKFQIFPRVYRKAIGIRDISITRNSYENTSELVSFPYRFNSPIDLVLLRTEEDLYQTGNLISYSISVDDGLTWHDISPAQNPLTTSPEIIAFNQNISPNSREPGVAYLDTPAVPDRVDNIRMRIVFSKLAENTNAPVLYSYQLIVKSKQVN